MMNPPLAALRGESLVVQDAYPAENAEKHLPPMAMRCFLYRANMNKLTLSKFSRLGKTLSILYNGGSNHVKEDLYR
ncbi:hypothetical protein D7Z26_11295 [Cohnella endophytica]|uniref:Uncharacterized protein n=1 Tax=Cohnella endophytica TaxID=2419778 RepID=A0A494XTQ2_9BACL|nr:hypothetical protein D7Z26_11295 [Cohnella endophytica]